jgi:hypothetical protein
MLVNRPHITYGKRDKRLGVARCSNELDFECVERVNMNHRAEVTCLQPMLGTIALQNDCIELVVCHE